jgi:CRISPR-associated protein Cas6
MTETHETEMIDVVFSIRGSTVVEDHALLLWQALRAELPWLEEESDAAVLPLERLGKGDGLRFVGPRARLVLRLPQRRVASADFLSGRRLSLCDDIEVGVRSTRALAPSRVIHSPCVDVGTADEGEFLEICRNWLIDQGMRPEIVCGRGRAFQVEGGTARGFSLMLYGLTGLQTLALQQSGLGDNRRLGCGIFVPHKNVAAVGSE